jgi:hypothetical protein
MPFIGNKPTAVPLTSDDIQDGTIGITDLSATGTKNNTTYLRGDNTFATISTGGGTQEFDAGSASTPSITTTGDTNTGIFFPAAETTAFTTNGTERMRITSDGRLQLATTSNMPYGANQVRFSFEFNSSAAPYYGIEMKDNGSAGTTYGILFSRSSVIGSISYNASSVSYNTTSDYRLKNNISDVLNAIDRVKQLKPIRFNFISEPNKTVDGFLAHEVQEVVPEAIVGEKDAVETYIDDDGNEQTRPFYQGIDQSKLVPLLTAGLQEAIAKIETLEARITALENN